MKDFLKYTAATIVGLFIFGIIVTALGVMSLVGIMASAEKTSSLEKGSVLVVNLKGDLEERGSADDIMSLLQGQESPGLSDMLTAIRKAKTNDNVSGIYLDCGVMQADMAQLQELREALDDFKKSGKWIVAYGETVSQGAYYVASLSNKLWLNPEGIVMWHGAGGQMVYLKGLLEKVGVKVVPIKVGKYKSATEMFTEDKMSEPNREQTERYVQGYWQEMVGAVGKSRGISARELNDYADRMGEFADPKELVKRKMVDQLAYTDEVKPMVKKLLKLDEDGHIPQVSVATMVNAREDREGETIAVYYAYGSIVNDNTIQRLTQEQMIVATDVCQDLEDLAKDDDVKAVVIRVNSGGGSAYASEQIWHAVEQLKAKKPVVVSMGGAAASGGYYMSAGANYIYAEPTTITGSIGIFGTFPDATSLLEDKLALRFDEVKTNRNTLMGTRSLSAEQTEIIQKYIDRGYLLFKSRVAQGRKMTMDRVEELAQGHVYLGSDALKLGLVDALGGLDKAVAKAAQLAKVKEYHTASYPAPLSIIDQLLADQESSSRGILNDELRLALGELYEPLMMVVEAKEQSGLQARLPFIFKIN